MIETAVDISAPPQVVFDAYVNEIDRWWPRTGTYRYSFAPPHTQPSSIRFEPRIGGRFYEVYADGSEYEIGRIVTFAPPRTVAYTWRAPDWDVDTVVEATFTPSAGGTRLIVRHRDLPEHLADGYAIGLHEILQALADHVRRKEP